MPKEGLQIAQLSIKFPTWSTIFDAPEKKTDIASILKAADAAENAESEHREASDTLIDERDKLNAPRKKIKRDTSVALITSIQMANSSAMEKFFEALKSLQANPEQQIRVLHYGDSQIEGDRITDKLRQKLQAEFGGSGPGLISMMPVASASAGW